MSSYRLCINSYFGQERIKKSRHCEGKGSTGDGIAGCRSICLVRNGGGQVASVSMTLLRGIGWYFLLALVLVPVAASGEPPVVQITPLDGHRAVFLREGRESLQWHFGADYPRPFFYPLAGPSGRPLTRMGHPGAPDHDHHQSIWFAHHDVEGHSFWSNASGAEIRQEQWLVMESGADEGIYAALLGWYAPDGERLLEQEMISVLRPLPGGESELELCLSLRCAPGRKSVTLGKTNFGLLAVRVEESLSGRYGAGRLTAATGETGEKAIFGKAFPWMDYSGRVAVWEEGKGRWVEEGVAFLDHPANPRHPTHWHVREDGWMGASLTFSEPHVLEEGGALVLRYLLYAHAGLAPVEKIEERFRQFSAREEYRVEKDPGGLRHHQMVRGRGLP